MVEKKINAFKSSKETRKFLVFFVSVTENFIYEIDCR